MLPGAVMESFLGRIFIWVSAVRSRDKRGCFKQKTLHLQICREMPTRTETCQCSGPTGVQGPWSLGIISPCYTSEDGASGWLRAWHGGSTLLNFLTDLNWRLLLPCLPNSSAHFDYLETKQPSFPQVLLLRSGFFFFFPDVCAGTVCVCCWTVDIKQGSWNHVI